MWGLGVVESGVLPPAAPPLRNFPNETAWHQSFTAHTSRRRRRTTERQREITLRRRRRRRTTERQREITKKRTKKEKKKRSQTKNKKVQKFKI